MFFSSPPWEEVTYWSLDLETGGLDTRHDAIVSVGMVPVRRGALQLGDAFESLIRHDGVSTVRPDAVAVHEVLPAEVNEAPKLSEVLVSVDARLAEGALLVHNAAIDVAFLQRAYAENGLRWRKPVVIDTVQLLFKLAKRRRFLEPDSVEEPNINLTAARAELGLPAYPAHNALMDAVATAELFLVLRHKLAARTLRNLR